MINTNLVTFCTLTYLVSTSINDETSKDLAICFVVTIIHPKPLILVPSMG